MLWTKRKLIEYAFDSAGLGLHLYDIGPEVLQLTAVKMDAMVGFWEKKGIKIKYPFSVNPENSDLDTVVGALDSVIEAIYLNLALRITPGYGKTPSVELKSQARAAYKNLLLTRSKPRGMSFPSTLPSGAGNRYWDGPFLSETNKDPLVIGEDGNLEFLE